MRGKERTMGGSGRRVGCGGAGRGWRRPMTALQLAWAPRALVVSGFTNAAIFNVDRTDDDAAATACTAAASDCSLRGAILASNANGSAADIINLPAGTYGRSTPYPEIGGGLSIVGAGAATTEINAQGLGRVLHFASQTSSARIRSGLGTPPSP